MVKNKNVLSAQQIANFYDRFGKRQDQQAFYEDIAINYLLEESSLAEANKIIEFGCGTGRMAVRILYECTSTNTQYIGYDLSTVMVSLAKQRLSQFQDRAIIRQSDGSPNLPEESCSADRVISTYVLDILGESDIRVFFEEAWRVLTPGGLVSVISLTRGRNLFPRLVMGLWSLLHSTRPTWVGGCRPINVSEYLNYTCWIPVYNKIVSAYGISSEVTIVKKV